MSRSAETIRKEMQHVRREIADDMDEVVESTRQMTDWHSYVNRYPLVCVGVAAAVGFMIVPKRVDIISPDKDTLSRFANNNKLVGENAAKTHATNGLTGTLLRLVGSAVLRAGIAYAGQHMGKEVAASAAMPHDA